jgi:Protein of unknown function (DUF4231)
LWLHLWIPKIAWWEHLCQIGRGRQLAYLATAPLLGDAEMENDIANYKPFSSGRRTKKSAILDMKYRLYTMHQAAEKSFLTDESRIAYWKEWHYAIMHAEWRAITCQTQYYILRLVALISAIVVPSLVGLNLSGTGGTVVRWLTFAFSLVAAIATSILTLYRFGDRWLMYRKLGADLMRFGWTLLENANTADAESAWATFIKNTDKAVADYNGTYESAVIPAAWSNPHDDGDHSGEADFYRPNP